MRKRTGDNEVAEGPNLEDHHMEKRDGGNDLMSETDDDRGDRHHKAQLSADSNDDLVSDGVVVKSKVNPGLTKVYLSFPH